jgi:hypothetical protein
VVVAEYLLALAAAGDYCSVPLLEVQEKNYSSVYLAAVNNHLWWYFYESYCECSCALSLDTSLEQV